MDQASQGALSYYAALYYHRGKRRLLIENSETGRENFTCSSAKPLSGKKTDSEYS